MAYDNSDDVSVRTILIEDTAPVRAEFAEAIEGHERLKLTGVAASYEEGSKILETDYDLLITDLNLGAGQSGIDFVRTARQQGKTILVISVLSDVNNVLGAMEAGADGYVLKGTSSDAAELQDAVSIVLEGGSPISPKVAGHLIQRMRENPDQPGPNNAESRLTPREKEILITVAKGYTNKEVGQQLEISHYTVAEHVKAIYRKMEVKSRTEAVSLAYKDGLILGDKKDSSED